ncbi:MAG: WbqC family protein [Bacteroidales bacterium]|nr:WbqC family protein [Bacteroidales bacterium]
MSFVTDTAVFSTAYLAPIEYFINIIKYDKIYIEKNENFIKQTFRNRFSIYSSNGLLSLTVPVKKINGNHTLIKDIKISYDTPWQQIHWKSLISAYNASPYFQYYKYDFEPFYNNKFNFLFDFNLQLLKLVFKLLNVEKEILFFEKFEKNYPNTFDLRHITNSKLKRDFQIQEYPQVFDDKYGFIPNLSIVDLLFNEGPNALNYLQEQVRN